MLSFLRFLYQDFLVNNLPLGMCWIWENVAYSGLILCKIVFGTVPTVPNETIHIYIYILLLRSRKIHLQSLSFCFKDRHPVTLARFSPLNLEVTVALT